MNTLATLLSEIPYDDQKMLDEKFKLLEIKLKNIFLKIQNCLNFEEAEYYLALLGQIQNILVIIHLKNQRNIPKNLWKFARDFDRVDDIDEQKKLFNEIKNKRYSLQK
ncbi:MAG: hypothetical protein AMXMBFR12_09010 [Candidatus Babeliales bacterium]